MPKDLHRQGTVSRGPGVLEGVLGSKGHSIVSAQAEAQRLLTGSGKKDLMTPSS